MGGHHGRRLTEVRARTGRAVRRVRDAAFGPPGAVTLVALATVLYRLGERPLWWWDESFYAVAARLALDSGHWVVPYTVGFDRLAPYPFLEKPPLAIWLEAVSIWLLGPPEFAVRLPSALAAVGTGTLLVVLAGSDRRLYEPATEGWITLAPGSDVALVSAFGILALVAGAALLTSTVDLSALARDPFPVDGGRIVRLAVVALVVGAVVVTLVGAPSVYATADTVESGTSSQPTDTAMRDFGQESGAAVPAGERVYVQPNAEAQWFYSSFVFYSDRGVRPASVERLRTDPSVEFAIFTEQGVSLADDRNPTVLARSGRLEVVLVRLEEPPEG